MSEGAEAKVEPEVAKVVAEGETDKVVVAENPVAQAEDKAPPKADKVDEGEMVVAQKYSKSVILEPKKAMYALITASLAVFCGAAAYIVMVFIALPLSIHSIVNGDNGCELAEDDSCFAPTDESQTILTLALTLLRVMTLLMGSFIGLLSDKYGRKPLMIFALSGYAAAGIFFLIGWQARNTVPIVIGAAVLGAASPITPHGIAYTTDISKPEDLAKNLGVLQGLGYFTGLMFGAGVSLGLSALTTGRDETLDNYDRLFTGSFATGSGMAFFALLLVFLFMPESLHVDDRKDNISIRNANPLGFTSLVFRRKYFFFVWLAGMFAWCAVGASESVLGGWWLRRYAISETQVFIVWTLGLWVSSALGAVFMTRIYLSCLSLKFTIHISSIMTILTGLIVAFAPNVTISYIAIGVSFFSSSAVPTLLAVIMGQVDSTENGALAGAIRSSEALGKLIGIVTIGNAFAAYIKPFRPSEESCMDTFDPITGANDCTCGVTTCPVFIDGEFRNIPDECDLGEMTFVTLDSASKDNPPLEDDDPYRIIPQPLYELQGVDGLGGSRPSDCLARGLLDDTSGLVSTQQRFWCASVATQVSPILNEWIGCPGYDVALFSPALAYHACSDGLEGPNASWVDLSDLDVGTANKECTGTNQAIYETLSATDFASFAIDENYDTPEEIELYAPIHGRVLDPDFDEIGGEYCEDEFDTMELNVCLKGTLTQTPWLFPFIILALLGAFSYSAYCVAEFLFIDGDLREWSNDRNKEVEVEKAEMENPSV